MRIQLDEYDPEWPERFEALARDTRHVLGTTLIRLEHVGSTAVPGLAAKPVIDMLLVVTDTRREEDYVPPLVALGYRVHVREPDWHEHRLLKRDEPSVNLHAFSDGCAEIGRMLTMRDRLRTHPEDRASYEAVKRQLASREWPNVQAYADSKSEIVELILSRAAPTDAT